MKKHYAKYAVIILLVASPHVSYAQDNDCSFEKAWQDEYESLSKKSMAQDVTMLSLLKKMKAFNSKSHDVLTTEEAAQFGEYNAQLKAGQTEAILMGRRLGDLETINQFMHIAQREFTNEEPTLSQKEIDSYSDQMKTEDPFYPGYDDEKVHELFLEYFVKEVDEKKISLSTESLNLKACSVDKALLLLVGDVGKEMPADNGDSLSKRFELMAKKYNVPKGQHIDETKLTISDKNVLSDLDEQLTKLDRQIAFVSRIQAISIVNNISSEMYSLSNEDLLKSGGSVQYVADHDFSKDFPENQHGILNLLIRLNDKLPSKHITNFSTTSVEK